MKKIIILFSFMLSLQIHAGGPIPPSLKHKKKTEIKGKSDTKKEVREYNKVFPKQEKLSICLLYTSDAADDLLTV